MVSFEVKGGRQEATKLVEVRKVMLLGAYYIDHRKTEPLR